MDEYTYETITDDARPNYRARVVADTCPQPPDGDYGSPLVRVEYGRYGWSAVVETGTLLHKFQLPQGVIDAAARWVKDEPEKFERYMRTYHGSTTFDYHENPRGSDVWVTFDTFAWRQAIGLEDAYMARVRADDPTIDFKLADMSEWKAYWEGEVYGVVIERQAWFAEVDPQNTHVVKKGEDNDPETHSHWIEVESCWNYFSTDYAAERAKEMLAEAA